MDAEWLAMARRCVRLAARRGEPLNGFRCRVHSTYTVQGRVASTSARACLSRFTPELGARVGIPFIYFEEARQGPVHGTRFSVREHAPAWADITFHFRPCCAVVARTSRTIAARLRIHDGQTPCTRLPDPPSADRNIRDRLGSGHAPSGNTFLHLRPPFALSPP